MYLKQTLNRQGNIFLSFVQGYRDEDGKVKQKTIENIGWLDELKKQYDDPISHFKEIAKQRNNGDINELIIKNLKSKTIDINSKPKNLGYSIPKIIYNDLGISSLLANYQKNSKIEYNLNDILSFPEFDS